MNTPTRSSRMNQCVDEMNSPGVNCLKSGKCVAKIRHPIRKVCVCVGNNSTPEEAADACTRQNLEYESRSEHETVTDFDKLELQSKLNRFSGKKRGSVYRVKSGKWKAEIQKGKVRHKLGSYATAEDAREALNRKKSELGLKDEDAQEAYDSKQSSDRLGSCDLGVQKNQRLRCVYPRKSGRWQTEIRHPVTKARIHLGTFDTADAAKEAYDSKRLEFDLMFAGNKKLKESNDSCKGVSDDPSVYTRVHLGMFMKEAEEAYNNTLCEFDLMVHKQSNGKRDPACVSDEPSVGTFFEEADRAYDSKMRICETDAEAAKEAYDSKRLEFDLMFPGSKKLTESNDSGKGDAIVEDKSDSACISDDPSVYTRVQSGTFFEEADRTYDSKMRICETDAPFETFAKEAEAVYNREMREFDLLVQSRGSCESDAIVEDKSDSDGSSVINVDVESLPVLDTERRGEFDLGIVDSYGRLVGEYSRLDDELWIC